MLIQRKVTVRSRDALACVLPSRLKRERPMAQISGVVVYLRWRDPRACHQRGGPAQRPDHRSRSRRYRREVSWLSPKAGAIGVQRSVGPENESDQVPAWTPVQRRSVRFSSPRTNPGTDVRRRFDFRGPALDSQRADSRVAARGGRIDQAFKVGAYTTGLRQPYPKPV